MLASLPPMNDSSPSKRRRRNTRGNISLERGSSGDFFLRSEDMLAPLRSEDVLLGGGLDALTSEDVIMRLTSADIVKDILIPDPAVTAAAVAAKAAGGAESIGLQRAILDAMRCLNPPGTTADPPPPIDGAKEGAGGLDTLNLPALASTADIEKSPADIDKIAGGEKPKAPGREEKIRKLRAKLERNITGDELVPLNMSFRVTSGDWINDLETESGDLAAVRPSLFLGDQPSSFEGDAREASTSPLPFEPRTDNYQEYSVPLRSLGSKPPSLRSLENARISSSDWVRDFKEESVDLGTMDPSLFVDAMTEQLAALPPPSSIPLASHLTYHPRSSAPKPSLKKPTNAPSAASAAETKAPPSASAATKKKRKKSRKRMLDETAVVEPTDGDVLSGRGGFTNTHPGNIRFRRKALELRPLYEESSKDAKQEIADILVEFVRNEGNRFLGKGKDGKWHEMIGSGPHYKASQALRERIRGGNDD